MYPQRIWRNVEFVPDKPGKTITAVSFYKRNPNPETDSERMDPTKVEHDIVAIVPGYAFIKTSNTYWGCGAHPLYGCEFVLAAFGSTGSVERVGESDYEQGSDVRVARAVELFNAQVDPAEPPDSLDGKLQIEDISVSMAYPAFTQRGSVWTILYTGKSTWAGSYGGWAGYTRSVAVPHGIAPARFREAIVMPEPVAKYIEAHEKDEDILGFTVGETSQEKK